MKRFVGIAVVAVFSLVFACAPEKSPEPQSNVLASAEMELRGGCRWECPPCHPNMEVCSKAPCVLVCKGQQHEKCGSGVCPAGQVCCNDSCGICTPPDGFCIEMYCEQPGPSKGGCTTDADCRTFSDYCTGCDCRALGVHAPDPVCSGPGVRCFADPCMNQSAVCNTTTGTCELASTATF